MTRRVTAAITAEDLQREGLRERPEPWEDGLRVEPRPGNFEWWYFDMHFDDGSTAVVVFFTKSLLDRGARLKPGVSLTITRPDGKKLTGLAQVAPGDFSASREHCYLRAGECWARGDLSSYELHVRAGDLSAHLNLSGLVPAWRPGAGINYYDEARTRFFGWLPAIPHGTVTGHLTYDGKIRAVKGTCYHDHNWGNVGLNNFLTHWYWGRAHLGEYTLIFAEMHATAAYGRQKLPVFMLAAGDQILIEDGAPLRLEEQDFIADPGGRSYPDGIDLSWERGDESVRLKLRQPALIDSFSLLALLPSWQRTLGSLFANPYYFRFNADLDLQINLQSLQAREQGKAIYELMLLR